LTRIPVIPARTVEKIIFRIGFLKIRQSGSHVFYRHNDGRTTTIPHHRGRDISPILLKKILKDINVSTEEFNELLNK